VRALVIVNPYANRWRAGRRGAACVEALRRAGLQCEVVETHGPGDALRIAAEQSAQSDVVVAVGGDGSVSEVVNGLLRASGAQATQPLGVVPVGTGNDFACMAGLPHDPAAAAAVIASGHTRQIDVARVSYRTAGDAAMQERFFDNNCALAMEPLVTIENTRIRRVSGNLRYVLALVRALRKLTDWHMRIEFDDGHYDGPVHLLSVCNSPRCGGLFRMAPQARMDDGLLDLVLAPRLSKLEIATILPRLLTGSHLRHRRLRWFRTRRLVARCEPASPIHADGEVLTAGAVEVAFEVLPGRLTLLVPPA